MTKEEKIAFADEIANTKPHLIKRFIAKSNLLPKEKKVKKNGIKK